MRAWAILTSMAGVQPRRLSRPLRSPKPNFACWPIAAPHRPPSGGTCARGLPHPCASSHPRARPRTCRRSQGRGRCRRPSKARWRSLRALLAAYRQTNCRLPKGSPRIMLPILRCVVRREQSMSVGALVLDATKKGVAVYLLIAFGLAWVLWEIALLVGPPPDSPLFQLAILPGAISPAVAAVVVRKWVTQEGFADAGLGLNMERWRYCLAGWCLPLAAVLVIVLLAAALGVSEPDFYPGPCSEGTGTRGGLLSPLFLQVSSPFCRYS